MTHRTRSVTHPTRSLTHPTRSLTHPEPSSLGKPPKMGGSTKCGSHRCGRLGHGSGCHNDDNLCEKFDELEVIEESFQLGNNKSGSGIFSNKSKEVNVDDDSNKISNEISVEKVSKLLKMIEFGCKYVNPSPIQCHAIPILMAGRDLMVCGKTAAFCFPIIAGIVNKSGGGYSGRDRTAFPVALIMSPSIELSARIHDEANKFVHQTGVKVVVACEGTPMLEQLCNLERGVDILVATPGRLVDIVERGRVSLSKIRYFALDEADSMLDMGFKPQIQKIAEGMDMPPTGSRQTMLFSVTFSTEIQRLASDILSNYIFFTVGKVGSSNDMIEQRTELVNDNDKRHCLKDLLLAQKRNGTQGKPPLTVKFAETKRSVDNLASWLSKSDFAATAIHGDKVQMGRERALRFSKNGATPIIVETDVAARGLDTCVANAINYDLPKDIEHYIHQTGPTGRAGKSGLATAFFYDKDRPISKALAELMEEANQVVPPWLTEYAHSSSSYGGSYGGGQHPNRGGKFGGHDFCSFDSPDYSSSYTDNYSSTSTEEYSRNYLDDVPKPAATEYYSSAYTDDVRKSTCSEDFTSTYINEDDKATDSEGEDKTAAAKDENPAPLVEKQDLNESASNVPLSVSSIEKHEANQKDGKRKIELEKMRYIDDMTCDSMDFIGLSLNDQNEVIGLEEVMKQTRDIKVGIIDSALNSKACQNTYSCFHKMPEFRHFHNCDKEIMLSGHGCACACVLAGKPQAANFFGLHKGTIRGVVPDVHLYVYTVGCTFCGKDLDMISKAFDFAIEDGVKVISMSQGERLSSLHEYTWELEDDVFAQKTLEAYGKNILTCIAVGNDGPASETILHGMPWCVNVGACATGKTLVTKVTIGTKKNVPRDVNIIRTEFDENHEAISILGTLEGISMNIHPSTFRVLRISNHLAEDREGVLSGFKDTITLIPSVSSKRHRSLFSLLNATKWPMASISSDNVKKLKEWHAKVGELYVHISTSESLKDDRGIFVPEFSARGPAHDFPEIIMPDLVAPGCHILTAYPENIPVARFKKPGVENEELIHNAQNILSGTSLATPHIAGLFVVLLSNRPHWSIATAKSAAITTAWSFAENGISGNEFAFGAGVMQVKAALNPGLVYDESFVNFTRYANKDLSVYRLNMPTFAASFTRSHQKCKRTFFRRLTNIEDRDVMYTAEVKVFGNSLDKGATIKVIPSDLSFSPGEEKEFTVEVSLCPSPLGHLSGLLIWTEKTSNNRVASPMHLYHRSSYDRRMSYKDMGRKNEKEDEGDDVKMKGKMSELKEGENTSGTKRSRC